LSAVLAKARASLAGLAVAAMVVPAVGQGQRTDWPIRTVTVVVPFAAGGNTDMMARLASQRLSEAFKQSFVVDNRVGAGGAIAAGYVAHAAPDGYTLLFAAAPQIAVLPHIQKVAYDPLKDFTPVSVFGTGPFILAISGAIPAKTIPQFVAYASARQLNYGSGGVGSVGHLSGALFAARAGINAVHVPYRGGAPAMTGLLGGQVDMYFGNAADIIPHVEGGRVRIVVVATETRMEQLPDIPTVSETFPGFALSAWNGFMVSAGTPRMIVDKLANAVIAVSKDAAVIEQLRKLGVEPNGTTPEEFAAQIVREQPQFDLAIAAANLRQP
jgi:tripartite-type tricarboxylate transporter receptor subunit TctC